MRRFYLGLILLLPTCDTGKSQNTRVTQFTPSTRCIYPVKSIELSDHITFGGGLSQKTVCTYDPAGRVVKEELYDYIQFGDQLAREKRYIWLENEVQIQAYDYLQFGQSLVSETVYLFHDY